MHGTTTYLPNKIDYFVNLSKELKTDVLCFPYRGFSYRDHGVPSEPAFLLDSEAMTEYFAKLVEEKGGVNAVEPIMFGRSWGCSTALSSLLSKADLYEILILEGAFTSAKAAMTVSTKVIGGCLGMLCKSNWRNDWMINDVKVPILFISGTLDKKCPHYMTEQLYRRA